MAATTKRKKVSKNKKQSWRKHTDIKDVEEHLEEARREERTGGPVSEKPDEGLFFVDKESEEITATDTDKYRGRSNKRKLLKVDQLILPESKIKPLGSKKRKINGKNRKHDSLIDSSDSDVEMEKRTPVALKENRNKQQTEQPFDLWETEDLDTRDEHFLATTRRKKVKKPKSINRKTSELEAVEVCSPGASYNPTYEDHQSLLQSAHNVELMKVKEIEKLNRQVKLLTPEEAAKLPTWTEEMSQGLFAEDDKDEDEDEDENEGIAAGPVRAADRKTKQQRRKEKEQEQEQKRLVEERKEKLRQNEIFRLKTLKKEINMAEEEADVRKRQKEEILKAAAKKPKRLSKYKYEAQNIELKLSGEITGSLRTLKQEGNLFEDRFKSLQRRNIIETRQPVKRHRKYKLKTYTRKSYDKPCIKEI